MTLIASSLVNMKASFGNVLRKYYIKRDFHNKKERDKAEAFGNSLLRLIFSLSANHRHIRPIRIRIKVLAHQMQHAAFLYSLYPQNDASATFSINILFEIPENGCFQEFGKSTLSFSGRSFEPHSAFFHPDDCVARDMSNCEMKGIKICLFQLKIRSSWKRLLHIFAVQSPRQSQKDLLGKLQTDLKSTVTRSERF